MIKNRFVGFTSKTELTGLHVSNARWILLLFMGVINIKYVINVLYIKWVMRDSKPIWKDTSIADCQTVIT